jgi:chondroitin AC lyase
MVHQRKDYYFSLKTTSNRTLSGESGNGENLKGYYQGNGTYYLVQGGNEYKEIFPIFNWRQLPGILAPQLSTPIPLFNWGSGARGASSFVYGISDSLYGCYAYDYQKDQVTARRAWFLFDHELVCLANSIKGDSLYQGINQCLLNGNVWNDGNAQLNGPIQKIFHDSVGYCILASGYPVVLKTDKHSGSWKDINQTGSAVPIEKKVFSLGIDLGPTVKDASLAYAIVPAVSLPVFKNYTIANHIAILQNNHQVQAVYQKDLQQVQAVFYADTTLLLPWYHLQVKMKQQGLLLIKKEGDTLVIEYSTPIPQKRVELQLHSKLNYDNAVFTIASETKHENKNK